MDDVEGWAHVRIRAAPWREVSQRRSGYRGGRQVLLRALPRLGGQAAKGPRARGPDRRFRPGPLPAERAVARLHDLLRHLRDRCGVDRPQEIRREGGRGRLQEGADRRRSLQVRELQSRRRPRDGRFRGLLAQDPQREAARVPQHDRRDDAGRGPQGRRRRHRLSPERTRRRRGKAVGGAAPGRRDAARRRVPRSTGAVGSQVSLGRQACAAGDQPRARSERAQSGGDPRALKADRRACAARAGVRENVRAARL